MTEEQSKSQNSLKEIANAIRSGNKSTIMSALREIRRSGNISILPGLFDLLLGQNDQQIVEEASSILNDLKNQQAAAVLAGALNNPDYAPVASILAGACWQNGLSYTDHIDIFVNTVINGDYETAIEAFTVIEEASEELEQSTRDSLSQTIKNELNNVDDQRKSLLMELIKVLG